MNSVFVHKWSFYLPSEENKQKNARNAEYIALKPEAERSGIKFEHGDLAVGDLPMPGTAAHHAVYAHERPQSTGLFGPEDERPPDLKEIQRELLDHSGVVWRSIVSLREDDAQDLGFTDRESWEVAIRASMADVAKAMGISESNLRWAAAFHAKQGHPHVHLLIWEAKPRIQRGKLGGKQLKEVKRAFMRPIYEEKRQQLYQEKTALRDYIRSLAKENIDLLGLRKGLREARLEIQMLNGTPSRIPPKMSEEIFSRLQLEIEYLAKMMPGKGRASLAYMPEPVKAQAIEIAGWILRQPGFVQSLESYQAVARELTKHHTVNPEAINSAERKAYEDIRNRVTQVVIKGAAKINHEERAEQWQQKEELIESAGIARGVWKAAWFAVERERTKAEAQCQLEKKKEEQKEKTREKRSRDPEQD